jgi:hypothetical protein
VFGLGGEVFVVLESVPDAGSYYVTCVTPERYAREMTLARRLLSRAREARTRTLGSKRERRHGPAG